MNPSRVGVWNFLRARWLAEHSPQLVITRPALVPCASSPTGWLLVVPKVAVEA